MSSMASSPCHQLEFLPSVVHPWQVFNTQVMLKYRG